ncbi:hypothetical protein N9S24_02180 [SAR86 cluster bacterium]|nr:hypothetical protein [SAR86 cluster bacterium]
MRAKKGFLIALSIFLTPFIVISASTFWYYFGFGPEERVNYGFLLSDPIDIGKLDLELDFQHLDIDSMERKWMMIHFVKSKCLEDCADSIYIARQVNKLLSREQRRVKRYIASPEENRSFLQSFFSTYQDLNFIKIKDIEIVMDGFKASNIDPFEQPNLFIVDPIGNIVLYYSGEIDGKKLLTDLKKLLKASKIG